MNRKNKTNQPAIFRRALLSAVVAGCFGIGIALGQPTGPQVINGNVSFTTQGNVLNITNTPNAIINWQGFSIAPNEVTRFIQQSGSSNVLNRVIGLKSSAILGALQSNGRVWLINPNGILIGPNARIDVNGLIASTLGISNQDFLAGKYIFNAGAMAGKVENQGVITTPSGGQILLLAPDVHNSGILTSPQGEILLAAGKSVHLVDTSNPDMAVVVSAPENQALNLGQIIAQSGKIGIYGALVNQRGKVSADSAMVGENGKIVFKASKDTLLEAGSVTSSTGAGKGGEIQVLGERVGLTGDAQVDASGQQGGGAILVGGDYQGKNLDIHNANITYFGPNASLKADAIANGDGGKVILWSNDTTRAYGNISALGGANSGNGGFVETSGKSGLLVDGIKVATTAPMGKTGMWLLDPIAINIVASGVGNLAGGIFDPATSIDISPATIVGASGLASTNVTIQTTTGGGGTITVTDPVTWGTPNSLSLLAGNGIAINGAINATDPGALFVLSTTAGNITQTAAITVPSLSASAATGAVTLNHPSNSAGILAGLAGGGTGFNFTNSAPLVIGGVAGMNGIVTTNQPVNLTNTGSLDIANVANGVNAGSGNVTLTSTAGAVGESTGKITANSLNVTAYLAINLANANAVNSLTASQTYSAGGGGISFTNNAPLTINGVSQAANGGAPAIALNTTVGNGITIAGPVTAGSATATLSINAGTSGPIGGSALLTANNITLQSGSSGAIGSAGSKLQTSSVGGSGQAMFTIGGTPSAVYLNHTGDVGFAAAPTLGTNAPVDITASHDLTASTINTGTANLSLSAGNLLTVPSGTTLTGANITLAADRMDLQGAANSIKVNTGTAWIKPYSAARNIDLGSILDGIGDPMGISTTELDTLGGTGILRIGALAAGNINLSGPVAPASFGAGTLSLESGGTITQATAADIITANKLAIKALGNVTLNTAPNVVTNLAAQIGDGTHQNNNFKLKSSNALNVGSNLDGVTGISTNINGTFNSAAPDGVIALTSSAALTQSAGALLGGKAVYAEGSGVILTEANPTGIIAGKATGNAGDIFSYTSSSGINVTTVNGFAGIQTVDLASASYSIILNAGNAGISQDLAAPINAAGGTMPLSLQTTGAVNLVAPTNTVGALETVGTGASAPSLLNFKNSGAMTIGTAGGNGIVTNNGSVNVTSMGGLVTVWKPINAGANWVALEAPNLQLGALGAGTTISGSAIKLRANQAATGTISTSGTASTINAGGISMEADNFSFAAAPSTFNATSDINYHTYTNNRNLSVSTLNGATNNVPWLVIGNDNPLYGGTTGNVVVDAAINRPTSGLVLLAGGNITQTAGITAQNLAFHAGAATLSLGNQVSTLAGATNGGAISYTNTTALNIGTVPSSAYTATGLTSSNGAVSVTATSGNITLQQPINAGSGAVTLTATTGAIAASGGAVNGASLNATASGGIGHGTALTTQVSSLQASNSGANTDIHIINSIPLTLGSITNTGTGAINIENTGALITSAPIQAGSGPITLTAHSPLTIGSSVSTSGGAITLTAGSGTSSNVADVLTINGPVTTSGQITLAANSTAGNSVPSGSNVTSALWPTLAQCIDNPALTGCASVLPSLASCTTTPTLAGCSMVLPSLDACTTTPTLAGCSAVLPSIAQCTLTPVAPGCSAVLPPLDQCMTNSALAGCSPVLGTAFQCLNNPAAPGCSTALQTLRQCSTTPTAGACSFVLSQCSATPTPAGCAGVLPSLSQCMSLPSTPGCSTVLPTLAQCTLTPTTAGCLAVLPTLSQCGAATTTSAGCAAVQSLLEQCALTPTTALCTSVLPPLAQCTANPAAFGCWAVLPTLSQCTTNPTTAGCTAVQSLLTQCTLTPTAAGCSTVLPTLSQCTTSPTTAGCSAVLPTLAQCALTPAAAGCSAVLPTLSQCTASPTAAGCSVVLPTLAQCTLTPTAAGCSAVLPTLSQCTTKPAAAGCNVVLPTLTQCTLTPTAAGCSAVLPTVSQCTTNPTAAGCSIVLPTLAQCTSTPATAGCSAVLPTLSQCMTNPTAAGCGVVLPSLAQCTLTPATAGCSAVLPTLSQCTANPATAGCSTILPTLAQCTTNPATAGCSAVLPTLSQCTANPATAGCGAILPTLAQCTLTPTTAGCSAVLPTLSQCTANPVTAGCGAILPTLAQCALTPTEAGCSAVLPTLSQCVTTPTATGCSAILPTLAQCTLTPTAAGCSAILPTLSQCTTSPTAAGCAAVLPALSQCIANPTAAGCSAVLPTLAQCTSTPTTAGCATVLPTPSQCTANPKLAGCPTVLPAVSNPLDQALNQTNNAINGTVFVVKLTTPQLPAPPKDSPPPPAGDSNAGGDTSSGAKTDNAPAKSDKASDDKKPDDKKKDEKKDNATKQEDKKNDTPAKKLYCN